MALGTQPASVGGAAKSLIVASDPNGNIAAAHVNVNSNGVEVGSSVNPLAVAVGNFPGTQSVSATSLPLPVGAATSVNQPQLHADGGALSHVINFPASQPVTQATGPWSVTWSGQSVGATQSGTWMVTLAAGTAAIGAVSVTNFPSTQTIMGQGLTGATPVGAPVSISGIDASGLKQHLRTDTFGTPADSPWSSGGGSLIALGKAMVAAQQATTAAVTGSSLVPPSPTFVQTTALTSSLLLKAAAGSLYSCYVTTGSTAGWLMVFDAVAAPVNGAVAPKDCIYCPANATTEIELPFLTAEPFATGITAVFSSTGPFTLTASSSAFIKGIVQ